MAVLLKRSTPTDLASIDPTLCVELSWELQLHHGLIRGHQSDIGSIKAVRLKRACNTIDECAERNPDCVQQRRLASSILSNKDREVLLQV
jgi:hypothetical protein